MCARLRRCICAFILSVRHLILLYNYGAAALRAKGDTRRPLIFLSISGVVNVILNLIFVLQFEMNVVGVALVTIISEAISALLVMRCLSHAEDELNFSYKKLCMDKRSAIDMAPYSETYCTDGYNGYLDTIFPGKHIFNPHNKNDTFTVEGVNADLRHYIPTLARRSRCFPRKLENLQAVLTVFVTAYNRFGLQKARYRSLHSDTSAPFSFFDFL